MALRFLNNGYFAGTVGIGTVTPGVKLDVAGSFAGDAVSIRAYNSVANFGNSLLIAQSDNANTFIHAGVKIQSSGSPFYIYQSGGSAANVLRFNYNSLADTGGQMVLTSTGNVGIGTSAPSAKLDIQGTQGQLFSVTDDLSGEIFAVADISGVPIMSINSSGSIKFGSYSGTNQTGTPTYMLGTTATGGVVKVLGADIPGVPGGSGTVNYIPKWTPDGDTLGNSAMFQSGNNISLGITTPNARLSVVSDISIGTSATDVLRLHNESGIGTIDGYSTRSLAFGSATNGEVVRIDNTNKRVGIGTTSPDAKLDIEGDFETTYALKFTNTKGTGTVSGFRSHGLNGQDFSLYNGANRIQRWDENGNSIFDGKVGIGTTSPLDLLALHNNATGAVDAQMNFTTAATGQAAADGFRVGWNGTVAQMYLFENADMRIATNNVERMRITSAGGISFGSTGTAYGTSGQVLTSGGNASPTWTTLTTGTVTGSGTATQVAFWDGTSSLSGNNDLYWDSTNNHLGIGDNTPGSRLKVTSGTSETSIYTVDINHVKNNPDVATNAMRINMDLSGADNTTADRTNSGLLIDIDSSANGDASNEHRIRGINSDVKFTGFSDAVHGGYFLAESNYTGGKTAQLIGVLGNAVHDTSATTGGVSNMYGVYGTSGIQDLGDVDNAFGGYFIVYISNSRGNANVGTTKGVEGEIVIDKADTITYGEMMAVSGIIDNNEGTVPTFGNQYLFKGDYQGTKGGNAYGIYTEGDKHYFDGNIGIRTSNPTSKLSVGENGITTKVATATIADTTAGASLTLRGGSPTIYFDRTGANPQNKILMDTAGLEFKTGTLDVEGDVDFKINPDGSLQLAEGAQISNQENTNIDSAASEVVAEVAISYTAAFFDFVVKKGTNIRSGTVYACHDGTNVEFTETSTQDLGDTSDVVLSVDKTSTNLRLIATVASDDWSVKSLIRAI